MTPFERSFATAFTKAFVADMLHAPGLEQAVVKGSLNARGLRNIVNRDLERGVRREGGPALFPNLRALVVTQMNVEEAKLRGGMSQWVELASAVIGATTTYVSAKTTAQTQTTLAKLDLQKQQLAQKAADLQAQAANMQLAKSQGFPGAITAPGPAGIPILVWILGAVALTGGGVYLLTRGGQGRGRRR